ncbi:MAG TPA: squalene--hopene cyclase [Pseudonocardiaceae bacterium]|jgi:squalene-hopene/tetraprenyl-beta-curcumene cyclase|nr:squalene--hopene cyclase [Pseudonocardiaceae bacterium]
MTALEADPRHAPVPRGDGLLARAQRTTDLATEYLLSIQDDGGWWKGNLQTNVTMDAEDLMLRQFLGLLTDKITVPAARWIRGEQRADGTWANFHEGPADLSTTIEAYVALRLAGDEVDAPHMVAARDYIVGNGGIEASRVFTRIWLALFGEWSWDDLPVMPPEMIFLPSWFPLNVYDWGCWARQTVVPLTIVCALRPVRSLGFDLAELHTARRPRKRKPLLSVGNAFEQLDKVLHGYEKLPVKPLRKLAMRQAVEWIVARQEADGCWGGIQPPWVYSIMALHLMGYALDHPVLAKAIAGLDGFTVWEEKPEGTIRWMEACQSPVWDTCLALTGLLDAGVARDHPAVVKAADWMIGEEIRVPGDWVTRRPGLAPGGWAFEFANDLYPDTDDTAEVVLALRRAGNSDSVAGKSAIERGVDWLIGMQSKDGGWGAFDADNTQTLTRKLPFCDFGAVIDPPSADVTAHVVEMLADEGMADTEVTRRGVRWLLRSQEDDGSWFGRWGANYVYGTGAVVPALVKAGVSTSDQTIRRAVTWLQRHQNTDGGWGEDLRSYVDTSWAGRGNSTASQTAWALLALLAAGETGDPVRRGIDYLATTQRADGAWDEPYFTGTGFPGDFYLNYHLYRMVFPLSALGRFLNSAAAVNIEAVDGTGPDGVV